MRSRHPFRLVLVSCIALLSIAVLAAPARAAGNCVSLAGTITGQLDLEASDPGWYGFAYLKFGNDPTLFVATLADLNDGYKPQPYKSNFAGYEILTFTIDGVGSFQMTGHFICMAGTTPNFFGFSEEGKLVPEAGTGKFAGMTGNISSHGSAAGGPTWDTWIWISQMTGTLCAQ